MTVQGAQRPATTHPGTDWIRNSGPAAGPAQGEATMGTSQPWTVRCVRRLYEYNTVVAEAVDLEQALARAVDAADANPDG